MFFYVPFLLMIGVNLYQDKTSCAEARYKRFYKPSSAPPFFLTDDHGSRLSKRKEEHLLTAYFVVYLTSENPCTGLPALSAPVPSSSYSTHPMQALIQNLTRYFQAGAETTWDEKAFLLVGIAFFSYLVTLLFRRFIIPAAQKLTQQTRATWDDYLFNARTLAAFCRMLPPVVWYAFLPLVFSDSPVLLGLLRRVCLVYLVLVTLRLVKAFLDSLYELSSRHERFRDRPLKGIYQMVYLLALGIGAVIIVSILFDKDPTTILTGLGASAAILMLVFKDSILGLVAGVQLSANDMLRPGDWITIPRSGVDGDVLEVSLTTIKIQNFDKTIVTIPPYALVSEAFQNWRGMRECGGRRIKRSLAIDMNTVRFCTDAELQRFAARQWLPEGQRTADSPCVNLEVFRHYLQHYLRHHPQIKKDLTVLVRELQPGAEGLPLEIYCFTDTVDWKTYEHIQCELFAHVLAVLPQFGLRVYQRFGGADLDGKAN